MARITLLFEETIEDLSDEELGRILKAYITDSNFNSWDAWPKRDLRGALALLTDIRLYILNR